MDAETHQQEIKYDLLICQEGEIEGYAVDAETHQQEIKYAGRDAITLQQEFKLDLLD